MMDYLDLEDLLDQLRWAIEDKDWDAAASHAIALDDAIHAKIVAEMESA